jgi:hypothetical protein
MQIQRAVVLTTVIGIVVASVLPPEHIHRGPIGLPHTHTLVHRHFAPHTAPNGTHIDRPGVPEGAPQWLDDPSGSLPLLPLVAADNTVLLFCAPYPALERGDYATSPPETCVHAPPRPPFALRAPPLHT